MAESEARWTCPRNFQPADSAPGIGSNPGLDRGRRPNQTKESPVSHHSFPQEICMEAPGQDDDVGRHVNRAARRDQFRAGPPSTCKVGRTLSRTGNRQLPQMETSLRALEPAWLDLQTCLVGSGEQSRDREATGVRACHGSANNVYVLE